jgi:hypothetical protein
LKEWVEDSSNAFETGADDVSNRHAFSIVAQLQSKADRQPDALLELPNDSFARDGFNYYALQAHATSPHKLIHKHDCANISGGTPQCAKLKVHSWPPALIGAVIGAEQEVEDLLGADTVDV